MDRRYGVGCLQAPNVESGNAGIGRVEDPDVLVYTGIIRLNRSWILAIDTTRGAARNSGQSSFYTIPVGTTVHRILPIYDESGLSRAHYDVPAPEEPESSIAILHD